MNTYGYYYKLGEIENIKMTYSTIRPFLSHISHLDFLANDNKSIKNQLIKLGEIHGFTVPSELDPKDIYFTKKLISYIQGLTSSL